MFIHYISDFNKFLKRNTLLLVLVFFITVSIYGVRLFNCVISIDTDNYLMDSIHFNKEWTPSEGRFAYAVLQNIFQTNDLKLNIFFAHFLSVLFLICSNFLWLYLIEFYGKYKSRLGFLLFSVFYISSSIWVEITSGTMMVAEMFFGLVLCPICVMLTFEALNDIKYSIISGFCTAFLMGLHQPTLTMYVEGILIVYILRIETSVTISSKDLKDYFKLIGMTVFSIITYFLLNIFFTKIVYKVEITNYVLEQIRFTQNIMKMCKGLIFYLYSVFVGEITILNTWLDPFLISHAHSGEKALLVLHAKLIHGSIVLLISSIIIIILAIKRKYIKNVLYTVSWIGIFFCLVAVVIAGGGSYAERFLYVLPLFSAYLIFYVASHIKSWKRLWLVICIFFAYIQVYNSSLLIASDQKRYELDQWLSREINNRISKIGGRSGDKILILGQYDFYYGKNFLQGELMGRSAMMFCNTYYKTEATLRSVSFMKSQGFNYVAMDKDDPRIDYFRDYAKNNMYSFPDEGCTDKIEDVIIVKLSDLIYKEHIE